MLESLFNNFAREVLYKKFYSYLNLLDFADLQSEILLNEILYNGFFSMKKFYLKNTFLTRHLRATASDTQKTGADPVFVLLCK